MRTVKVYCRSNWITYENTYGEDGPYTGYCHDGYEDHVVTFDDGNDSQFEEKFETDLENPHLVYVIYSSGGTFGRTDGYFRAIGLYSLEDANKVAALINESASFRGGYSRVNQGNHSKVMEQLKTFGVDYDFWNGYFERLGDVVVLKVT